MLWHGIVASAVFLFTALYPRTGQAGLLLSMTPHATGEALAWLRGDSATLLGAARDGRHFVVRINSDTTALRALAHGWLLIATPDTACRSLSEQRI